MILAADGGGGGAVVVVVVVVGLVALAVVGMVLNQRATEKRQAAYRAWAAAHGFTYQPRDDRYRDLPWGAPFGTGSGRRAQDVLEGTLDGRPALVFTYHYQTTSSNGKTTQTHHHYFALFALTLPRPLPELRVGPEGFFGTIARAVGIHDIEFESEEFNRAYKVQAQDRRTASDVVQPKLMQYLLDNQAPGFHLVDGRIVLATQGRVVLEEVEQRLHYLNDIVATVPGFLWQAD